VSDVDPVREEAASQRRRRDQAYGRLPHAARQALNARYLESCVQTGGDADAADVAVRDELRWQTTRAEELLRGSSNPGQR
jgi:hypothetical protein